MSNAEARSRTASISIAEALGGRHNSLGFLRLVLATLVIFDHAFPLGGFGEDILWGHTGGQASFGTLAVGGFFAISGYLIAKSGMSADVMQFLWRRVLRIFPAYWLVLIVTAVIVGPVIWAISGESLRSYFTLAPNGPVNYFTANWTLKIGSYALYDIFADTTPYGHLVHASVMNGSLWTLYYEFLCYLLIAVAVVFGVMKNARVLVPIFTGFLLIAQVANLVAPEQLGKVAPILTDSQFLFLTLTFLVGSTIAVYSRQVPFDDRLGIFAGAVFLVTLRYGGFQTIGVVAGVYFILYLAARLPRPFQRIGAKNDYSYGVYIYGFLVQQILAFFGVYKLGYFPFVISAAIIAFGCAWLSWHLVEKRAMELKGWGPGRGIQYWSDRVAEARRARASRQEARGAERAKIVEGEQ